MMKNEISGYPAAAESSRIRVRDRFQLHLGNQPRCWATKTRRHEEESFFSFRHSRAAWTKPQGCEERTKTLKSLLRVFVAIDAAGYPDAAESSRVREWVRFRN
jgi:hypothetical protein